MSTPTSRLGGLAARTLLAAGLAGLAVPATALADAKGDEVLAKVESRLSAFEDQQLTFEVANLKPGSKNPQSMSFKTVVKGPNSFTEFLAPGDIKGTRVLSTSPTQMWVYLPEFGKVRRVASHSLEAGFMGTTLTQQDMAPPAYVALFTPTFKAEDESTITLQLDAKDGVDVAYRRMVMTVDKALQVPTTIDYLDESGEVVRRETRKDYTCADGYCLFGSMKMEDLTRGAWTELKPVERQINTGVSDDTFDKRTLMYGL